MLIDDTSRSLYIPAYSLQKALFILKNISVINMRWNTLKNNSDCNISIFIIKKVKNST